MRLNCYAHCTVHTAQYTLKTAGLKPIYSKLVRDGDINCRSLHIQITDKNVEIKNIQIFSVLNRLSRLLLYD